MRRRKTALTKRNRSIAGVSGNTVSGKVNSIIRKFTQQFNMNKTNINVSTGASTYYNSTSSATYYSCTSGNVTSDPMAACFFTLGDMPQYSAFTALFDQYRINSVTVTFTPTLTGNTDLQSSSSQPYLSDWTLWYTVDLDDASVISPLTALMEYEGVRCLPFTGKPHVIKFVPHTALAAYAGAFTSYANVPDPWLDCASSNVQHFGLNWGMACPLSTVAGLPSYSLRCSYDVSFRGVR
jgi:hypothetical protein